MPIFRMGRQALHKETIESAPEPQTVVPFISIPTSLPERTGKQSAIYKLSSGNFNSKEVRLLSDLRLSSQLSLVILHMLA